ncbi:MAG: hypothetical protein CR975_02230 [Gammaproteobacteria bacterium]|nr:MAG: hypothetical protein CR975_02230 [Gammaproteobacteria bacterium]
MKTRNRSHSQRCPTCQHKAYVTTTRAATDTITERYFLCKNPECGHAFKTITQVTETIIPPLAVATEASNDQ